MEMLCAGRRCLLRTASVASMLTALAMVPALALAAETDRLTVEDPVTNAVKFRLTSEGNVTGGIFTGDGSGLSNVAHFKGTWNGTTAYAKDDCVNYGGSSYIALAASTNAQPDTTPASWAVFASVGPQGPQGSKGDTGIQGLQGPEGPQGPQGPAGSPDTQAQILSKLATKTDGAVLSLQQGSNEGTTALRVNISDSAGKSRFAVDSLGHLGMGTTSPIAIQHLYADYSSDFFFGEMAFSDGWPTYKLLRARGYNGAKLALLDGDIIGRFVMWGYDGTNYNRSGSFEVAMDGAPTAGSSPGRLSFSTVPAGSGALTERMRITSAGNVGIGSTDPSQKLEVNGGIRVNTATAKPACSSSARGTFWVTQGAAGTSDSVEVCIKDAVDAYVWKSVW